MIFQHNCYKYTHYLLQNIFYINRMLQKAIIHIYVPTNNISFKLKNIYKNFSEQKKKKLQREYKERIECIPHLYHHVLHNKII